MEANALSTVEAARCSQLQRTLLHLTGLPPPLCARIAQLVASAEFPRLAEQRPTCVLYTVVDKVPCLLGVVRDRQRLTLLADKARTQWPFLSDMYAAEMPLLG